LATLPRMAALMTMSSMVVAAAAAEKPRARPELFDQLIGCKTISDAPRRLACYDQSVGAIEEAERKQDLVIVDRGQIRETRKSLFGFSLPRIGLFGGGKDEGGKDEISEIQSIVASVRSVRGGDWSLRLADDAGTWETISPVTVAPRAGDKIRIRKAALGSYLGQVGINRGVRFRRVE